jgi:hypothetical protein
MRRLSLLLFCLCLVSCAAGPPRIVGESSAGRIGDNWKTLVAPLFPTGTWRFVHSIEATLPGGRRTVLIGVTEVSSRQRRLHCVLMSIEGLVLFDARGDGTIRVERAIAPFDSKKFAQGLMADVALMLLAPPGAPVATGTLKTGEPVCRYRKLESGGKVLTTDVIREGKECWVLNQYEGGRLRRSLRAQGRGGVTGGAAEGVPEKWRLTAYGPGGYCLYLKLLEAEPSGAS